MGEMTILWLVVLIAAVVIEAMTMGLTTIWFAGGALAALLIERLNGGIYLQVIVCLVVSLVLLYFTRPVAVKHFNKGRQKTNLDALIGKQAVVTSEICNLQGTGKVTVSGQEWSAKSEEDELVFAEGEIVRIAKIKGVKLIVKADKKKEGAEC